MKNTCITIEKLAGGTVEGAAVASGGGGAPAAVQGGGGVGELHRSEGNPFPVLVGVEEGRKRGLRSGSGDGGGHGDGGGVPGRRGGWGLVLGQEKWRVRGE